MHAGAEFILHFLRIDSESTFALTNQSSSIHLWLTVVLEASVNPHKRLVELNDGSSNYGEIELHVHRGSKRSCRPTPRGLKYDHPVLTTDLLPPRFNNDGRNGQVHVERAKNQWWPARTSRESATSQRQPGFVPSSSFPSVCSSVPLAIRSLLSLLQLVCQRPSKYSYV